MRHSHFRRIAATGAVVGGVCGIAANAALLGFYALAQPWEWGFSPWAWLGPANDVIAGPAGGVELPLIGCRSRAGGGDGAQPVVRAQMCPAARPAGSDPNPWVSV
jgi:hypothetical protein